MDNQSLPSARFYWRVWFCIIAIAVMLRLILLALFGHKDSSYLGIIYAGSTWLSLMFLYSTYYQVLVAHLRIHYPQQWKELTYAPLFGSGRGNFRMLSWLDSPESFNDAQVAVMKSNCRGLLRLMFTAFLTYPILVPLLSIGHPCLSDTAMQRSLRLYLWLAFGITWGVGGLALLIPVASGHPLNTTTPFYFIAGYGPTLAGVLASLRLGGGAGVRRLLGAALPTRASVVWYPIVLVGYPALALVVGQLFPVRPASPLIPWGEIPLLLAATLLTDTGPLGEEFGWRGFALPRLLARLSSLVSGLIVGLAWAAWHLPTFFIAALPQSRLSIPWFFVSIVALSVAQTGLFVGSKGRLDLMVLVHLVANFWASYLSSEARAVSHIILALVAISAARMWTRATWPAAPDHALQRTEPGSTLFV